MTPPHSNSPESPPEISKNPASHADRLTPSKPRAAIFDVGRVIVRLNLNRAFAPIAAAITRNDRSARGPSAEQTWKIIQTDERWPDWQEGRLSPVEWHKHLMRRLNLSLSCDEFREAWNRVLDPELILDERLFTRLSAQCRLALLSNTDPIHAEALDQSFTFTRHFPVRIYSYSLGASKPSPAIYRAALESLGTQAQETLYIDDIQEFVEAGRQIGLDAIRFQGCERLERELRRRDLL